MKDLVQEIFNQYEWTTQFTINNHPYGGSVRRLLMDERLVKFDKEFPVRGKQVLELGPLEAAHTITLKMLGAASVVSIEGQVDNFYKCCMISNLLSLQDCHFFYDDIEMISEKFLKKLGEPFDVCLCCGILYHLTKPWELLKKLAAVTDRLFIWTHVASDTYPATKNCIEKHYIGRYYTEVPGHMLSGLSPKSFWPYRSELLSMLEDAGFINNKILEEGVNEAGQSHILLYSYKEIQ